MFRLNLDAMRIEFTLDDRDLALAFVEMEGCMCVTRSGRASSECPASVRFGVSSQVDSIEPFQVSAGVFAYKIVKRRGKHAESTKAGVSQPEG